MIEFNHMRKAASRWRLAGLASVSAKLAVLGFALVGATAADAKTIYVNAAASVGGNGTTWNRAFAYLQDALDVSAPGDNVYLAKGTYFPDDGVPNGFGDRELWFILNRVNLYGGFVGNETAFNQRNPSVNKTILSGEIWEVTPDTQGYERYWSLHVVEVKGSARIDGVTIQRGRANGEAAPYNKGGGVLVTTGQTLTLNNCVVKENYASQSGGGVSGTVVASFTEFSDNEVDNLYLKSSVNPPESPNAHWLFDPFASGGAIDGAVSATRCNFLRNRVIARDLDLGFRSTATGGAISGPTVLVKDCNFDANFVDSLSDPGRNSGGTSYAFSRGGAISGVTTATRCTFTNNSASSSAESAVSPDPRAIAHYKSYPETRGGAIAGKSILMNCVFDANTIFAAAPDGDESNMYNAGSAVYLEGASSVANCVFNENSAETANDSLQRGGFTYSRGAILVASGGVLPLSNSTFYNNHCDFSGAAVATEGSLNIISNVFWYDEPLEPTGEEIPMDLMIHVGENPNSDEGGGRARISNRLYPTPSTETINVVKGGFDAISSGANANFDFGTPPERTFIGTSPEFSDFANPAGLDGVWRTGDDGLRLKSTSPAIGKGLGLFIAKDTADLDGDGNTSEPIPMDIAGYVRVQGGSLDLGAYEFGNRTDSPDISVEYPSGVVLVDNQNTIDLSGFAAVAQTFVIRNTGVQSLNNLVVTGTGANVNDFRITQPKTKTLSNGSTTTFTVTFVPKALGDRIAELRIVSNDPDENPFNIALKGNSKLPDIAVQHPTGTDLVSGTSSVSYGSIASTSSATKTFTIRNTGLGNLGIDGISASGGDSKRFIPSAPAKSFLAPGASTTFTVRFDPSGGGSFASTLVVASTDPDAEAAFKVKVSGFGFNSPEIVVSQPFSAEISDGERINYGNVKIASQYTKSIVIKNIGTAPLKAIKVSLAGSNTFNLSKFKVKKLKPGASAQFQVTFNPKSIGKSNATLTIVSNDSDEGQIDITLTGNGVKQANKAKKSKKSKKLSKMAAPAFAQQGSSLSSGGVIAFTSDQDGLKYQVLTVEKTAGQVSGKVEVSSDLVDWFSGSRHTTTLVDSATLLKVRDNTPVKSGEKRYIRLK